MCGVDDAVKAGAADWEVGGGIDDGEGEIVCGRVGAGASLVHFRDGIEALVDVFVLGFDPGQPREE